MSSYKCRFPCKRQSACQYTYFKQKCHLLPSLHLGKMDHIKALKLSLQQEITFLQIPDIPIGKYHFSAFSLFHETTDPNDDSKPQERTPPQTYT